MSDTKICPHCAEEIKAAAIKCRYCKEMLTQKDDKPITGSIAELQTVTKDFTPVIETIRSTQTKKVPYFRLKPIAMFTLMNMAVAVSALIIFRHIGFAFLAILIGMIGPFISLLFSKFLAKMAFDLKEIDPNNFKNENEQQLYRLVEELSKKAGLETVPEVAVYQSPDINAFATGRSRSHSIVAFSSALLDKMDEESSAAVAAHEIAHIANGDMLAMTLMQSVVNTVIILINIGLAVAMDNDDDGIMAIVIKAVARLVVVCICMFLGHLLLMWYSRHREYKADALAAKLVNTESMVKALKFLKDDENLEIPEGIARSQQAYATFKISSTPSFAELFSTHPDLDKRIASLKRQIV